ncbi:hypothetical protein HNQ88_005133 [Aureibacter tunicatorum]|uniref:Uncharacterized protein n=1 Tax=Aureibacter tunicatorum TaxID=866807 RepID=A0AAE3XQ91_9BACT|nr:hypothetical protein [Aureibacter tunicatorum]BDD03621.1 hypothetical protein AUTU_11040 [Aureibacter tunicatorum]
MSVYLLAQNLPFNISKPSTVALNKKIVLIYQLNRKKTIFTDYTDSEIYYRQLTS